MIMQKWRSLSYLYFKTGRSFSVHQCASFGCDSDDDSCRIQNEELVGHVTAQAVGDQPVSSRICVTGDDSFWLQNNWQSGFTDIPCEAVNGDLCWIL